MSKINFLILLNIGLLFISLIEPSPSDILFIFIAIFAFKEREVILEKIKRQRLYFFFMYIFLIISSLSLINAVILSASLKYYLITLYLICYSFIIFCFSDETNYKLIFKIYIIGSSIAALLGILGCLGFGSGILTYDALRTKSLFKDPNVFGPYLIPAIIFLINNVKEKKIFKSVTLSIILLAANFAGLVLSFSRGAYLSFAIALFLYFILNFKAVNLKKALKFILIFSLIICAVWLIFPSEGWKEFFISRIRLQTYDSSRFAAQYQGLALSLKHFLGYGPGQFENIIFLYLGQSISAHSLYVRTLVESGLLGSVLFFSSFIYIAIQLFHINRKGNTDNKILASILLSIMAGIMVNSLVIDTIHWRHLWLFAGLSLSFIDSVTKKLEALEEGYSIEILSDINKLKIYEDKWNSLLEENKNNNVFLEQSYILKYWQYFHSDSRLFILILIKDEEIIGFCPLMKKRKLFYNQISFIGIDHCSHMDFIIGNKLREESLKNFLCFLKNMKGSYILNLFGIEEESLNFRILSDLLKDSRHYFKSIENRYININGNFNDFFNIRKKHWTIKTIKNKGSKLKKLGLLTYENISEKDLDYTFSLHEKRWLKKLNGSSYSKEETRAFLKDLILDKNLPFKAEIKALLLDKRIVAYGYIFKYRDRFLFYRICHDDDFAMFSPGILLSCILIEDAYHQEYKIFDFSTGYERFKEEWTDDKSYVYSIIIPSSSYAADLYYYVSLIIMRLRLILKKSNFLVNFKRKRLGRIKYILSLHFLMDLGNMIRLKFNDVSGFLFPSTMADASNYKIFKLSINDLKKLSVFPQLGKNEIIKKIVRGDTCIYVKENESTIHCCFINKSNIYESHTVRRYMKNQKFFNMLVHYYLKIS
jgi:CelD/BcsL family acetyltransferase involved in cellulose biosynthesis/O-antigen ligase